MTLTAVATPDVYGGIVISNNVFSPSLVELMLLILSSIYACVIVARKELGDDVRTANFVTKTM